MTFKSKKATPAVPDQINLFLHKKDNGNLILYARDIRDNDYKLVELHIKDGQARIFRHEGLQEAKVGIQVDLIGRILIDKEPC